MPVWSRGRGLASKGELNAAEDAVRCTALEAALRSQGTNFGPRNACRGCARPLKIAATAHQAPAIRSTNATCLIHQPKFINSGVRRFNQTHNRIKYPRRSTSVPTCKEVATVRSILAFVDRGLGPD
ncbi:hypothetical protein VTI28DRAFT_1457 [Corynascus sepedonium]